LRNRAKTDGSAAVLEPRTRRPKSSPSTLSDEVKEQAIKVRAALEQSGLDHGPVSVHDKMRVMGLAQVPSTASLARIFREAGVARLEPKKKPRSPVTTVYLPGPERVLATGPQKQQSPWWTRQLPLTASRTDCSRTTGPR
jgi:putative transposase